MPTLAWACLRYDQPVPLTMAKFSFRLASLLRLREATRDERRQSLAEVLREDDQLADRLVVIRASLAALRDDGQLAARPGLLNVERLRDAQRYELALLAEQQAIAAQRALLADEIERRRLVLVESDTEVRSLEKLREAGLARHQDEQQRDEIYQLDEVAIRQAFEKLS